MAQNTGSNRDYNDQRRHSQLMLAIERVVNLRECEQLLKCERVAASIRVGSASEVGGARTRR